MDLYNDEDAEGETLEYYNDRFGGYARIIEHGTGIELWRYRDKYGLTIDYEIESFDSLNSFVYNIPHILFQRGRLTIKEYKRIYGESPL